MKMQVSWRGLREEQVLGTRPDHREQVHRDRTGSWSLGPDKLCLVIDRGGKSSTSSYLGGRSLRGGKVVVGLKYSLATASTSTTTVCGLGRAIRMNCFCMCLQQENTAMLAKKREIEANTPKSPPNMIILSLLSSWLVRAMVIKAIPEMR